MTLSAVIDDHVITRCRELLDAEDAAFDELEHAYEEGKRATFDHDMAAWCGAIAAKLAYLRQLGIELGDTSVPLD